MILTVLGIMAIIIIVLGGNTKLLPGCAVGCCREA